MAIENPRSGAPWRPRSRTSRHNQNLALYPVAHEGPTVGREEVRLIGPQLEEGQRVSPVAPNELGGQATRRWAGERPGNGQWPEDQVGHPQQRPELDQVH